MYCLRVFIVVLQELHCSPQWIPCVFVVSIEKHVYTKFYLVGCCVSELHAYPCPIVMYCLRLFIVVLQELQHFGMLIPISSQSFICQFHPVF